MSAEPTQCALWHVGVCTQNRAIFARVQSQFWLQACPIMESKTALASSLVAFVQRFVSNLGGGGFIGHDRALITPCGNIALAKSPGRLVPRPLGSIHKLLVDQVSMEKPGRETRPSNATAKWRD